MAGFADELAKALQLHQSGRLADAAQIYRQIPSSDPLQADALHLLGVIELQQGRYSEAVGLINRALQLNGKAANFHKSLGYAYRALQRTSEAIACFNRALELQPDFATVHINLGNALMDQGNVEEAIIAYCRGLELQPDMIEAYCHLANALRRGGRLQEADACCRKALELQPDYVEAHDQLGQVLQDMGHLDAALGWYRSGLRLNPESSLLHFNIARLFQEREQYSLAMTHFERATELVPEFADAHHGRGMIHYEQGELEPALRHYREALRLRPDFGLAHCGVGIIYQEQGDLDGAAGSFQAAIRYKPDSPEAYVYLAGLLRNKLSEAEIATIRLVAAKPNLMMRQRSALHFGLALVADARCDYAVAAEDLRLANSLNLADHSRRGIVYNPEEHDRFATGLIETFTPSYFERVRSFGVKSERPIFIIGLPRSGTTLTEQILTGHSQVFGAGELGLGCSAFASLPTFVASSLPALACVPDLDAQLIERIAINCLDRLSSLDATALRITDKLPDNYLYAGLIATLFPHARIIHCRRDMRDVAVSCWMADFRQLHWANSFEHIASRFHAYGRLMEHWYRNLPIPILHVDYEETVRDVETTAKRLISWCGLEWEQGCVAFHENRRTVRTASSIEVRKPAHQNSVGRWKHYEMALGPLFSMLKIADTSMEDAVDRNTSDRE